LIILEEALSLIALKSSHFRYGPAVAPDRHGDLMGDGVNIGARLAALTTSKHALAAPSGRARAEIIC
jgi:hypothetical protein